jgi:hypothetical protein
MEGHVTILAPLGGSTLPPRTYLTKQLRTIRRSTRLIARAVVQLASQVRRVERDAARKPTTRAGRQLRISPKRRAQLKLQGAYMGYMRQLRPRQKVRVKAVKERRGIEAAIKLARVGAKQR